MKFQNRKQRRDMSANKTKAEDKIMYIFKKCKIRKPGLILESPVISAINILKCHQRFCFMGENQEF